MIKRRLNLPVFFVLIIAFLAMQNVSAHIHLLEYHEHDGAHHHHQVDSHAHNLSNQHFDEIESFDHTNASSIIELGNSCNASSSHKKLFDVVAIFPVFQLNAKLPTARLKFVTEHEYLQNTLKSANFNPRAPPHSA